jgi:hypothetical protein
MCCQVVFSRAVIALGSDWGKELTGALSPFEFVGLRASRARQIALGDNVDRSLRPDE